jgi:cell division protein FtsZ
MALIELDENANRAKIKVIGVGGGGGNAINSMIASNLDGVDFIAANTDCQSLESNMAPLKVVLGQQLTKGLGAGANPDIGRAAALEDVGRLAEVLRDCDMVFVTAGMGGGTGTGAAPVIAQVARECGALTVGVVTKPFFFEGKRRRRQCEDGIEALGKAVDSLITIPNDRLLDVAGAEMAMIEAFRKVDEVLLNAVQGITDLITVPGLINVDFADVRTIMANMGRALMGAGRSAGKRRAVEAAQQAIQSPLLEDAAIDGATGVLINITGGPNLTLAEVREAAAMIQEAAHEDANIIFGSVINPNMGDDVCITVIATGFDRSALAAEMPAHTRRPGMQTRAQQQPPQQQPMSFRGPRHPTLPLGARTRIAEPMTLAAPPPPPPMMMNDDSGPVITLEPPVEPVEPANFTGERGPRGGQQRFGSGPVLDEDEIDIPTFLRRQTHPANE